MHPSLRWFVLAAVLGVSSCQHLSAAVRPAGAGTQASIDRTSAPTR